MNVISLGWGIQSFTIAAMVAVGELEPVDVALHADTTHERRDTYTFAQRWTPWLEQRGVRVVTVGDPTQASTVRSAATGIPGFPVTHPLPGGGKRVMIPAYTATERGGMLRRQCTRQWKVVPMRRWLRVNRNGQRVDQWLGISLDEVQRMRDSDVKYISHRYPLVDLRMTRHDCVRWLERHGLEVPPKSACVFCPFHDMAAWRELKQRGGEDWYQAVEVDETIRHARPPYSLFVHPARIPLVNVDLRTPEDRGQLSLWDTECAGVCGV